MLNRFDHTFTRVSKLGVSACTLAILALASGCSGGGGGSSGPEPIALRVTATGATQPLWTGATVGGAQCVQNLGQNAELLLEFGGPVDPASVPQGTAMGSIEIRDAAGNPLMGTFRIQDDPALPAGNQRQVIFSRGFPGTVGPGAFQGWPGPELWSLRVAGGPNALGATLVVAGQPLQTEIITCFSTCDPQGGGCFSDPTPGAAFVVTTVPPASDPAPAPIPAASITGNQVVVTLSEPINPSSVTTSNFQVMEMASSVVVPGSLAFEQALSNTATSRIIFTAADAFVPGRSYEIVLQPGLVDFGGLSVTAAAPGGISRLMFAVSAETSCPQTPLTEDFSTTAQLESRSGLGLWSGNGVASVSGPDDLTGDGSYGPLVFAPGPIVVDTGMPAAPGFANGTFAASSFSVDPGANVRFTGVYPLHVQCTGNASLSGSINASAGAITSAPNGSPDAGPGIGAFNNGGVAGTNPVRGGIGGPGGGSGGRASVDPLAEAAPGEVGFGPSTGGMPNTGAGAGASSFGGGAGGASAARFPAGGVLGDRGGLGGAGGSAFLPGGNAVPSTPVIQGCLPVPPGTINQLPAMAVPSPASFSAPIFQLTAGSGGGGGGDRLEPQVVPSLYQNDQGGGGGGGGGGVRISAAGDINLLAGCMIECRGATGGLGNTFFGGGGGSGSGGLIWLQSLQSLNVSPNALFVVDGGLTQNSCSDHAGGEGGVGLIQVEDTDGMVTMPSGVSEPSSFVALQTYAMTGGPQGVVTSKFFDTGTLLPNFTSAVATTSNGTVPGGAVVVMYQGAREAVSGGAPDLGALSPWVAAASIDQLDDYRYVRFRAEFSYQTSPLPGLGLSYPSVSSVSIGYDSTANCP